ncbi:hypothetical protein ACQPZX_42775 [Actinoplanes sp. CA-142083]|uniref:hypothetical protein n=1 Tax=Actinoplanes sp. CA-142083 TaxID=3239903 RepID=UPI003D9025A5
MKKAADTGVTAVGRLRKELDLAEGDLKKLAAAYANAGSASERIDITKQMRQQERSVRELKKSIGLLDLGPDLAKAGSAGGAQLGAAVGIAAAPFIGATLSAAIIGGAGIGGLVGGAYLAARDPRVKSAGSELGKNLLGELERDAAPFVDPLLRNIEKVEIRFGQMSTRIESIFGNSSGFMDPLVDGVLDGVDGILRGVDALVAKAGPVISAFGRLFGKVGDATGTAFEIIAGGSDEAADAVDDLAAIMQTLIVSTGVAVRVLTEAYGVMTFIPRKIMAAERALGLMDEETKATASTTSALAAVQQTMGTIILSAGEAAGQAGLKMQTYADRMNDAAGKGRSLYDSQTQVAQAVADVKEKIQDGNTSLDINTQKGRDNRNMLSGLAQGLVGAYNGYVQLNGEGRAAQGVADANRKKFIDLATAFTGSKKKAEELATQFGLIPAKKTTDFQANTRDAEARAKALAGKLDAAARTRTANVQVVINTGRLSSIENRLNRLGGSLYNAGGLSWAALDSGSGLARTGGPTPVSVSNSFGVYINGVMDRASTVQIMEERADRDAWRQRVGQR